MEATCCTNLLWEMSTIDQCTDAESRFGLPGVGVGREWGVSANGFGVSFGDNEDVLPSITVTVRLLCEDTKSH